MRYRELLWGHQPITTIDLIKQYKPETNSLCSGQVLQCPYDSTKAKLIVKEMTDLLVLDLVENIGKHKFLIYYCGFC